MDNLKSNVEEFHGFVRIIDEALVKGVTPLVPENWTKNNVLSLCGALFLQQSLSVGIAEHASCCLNVMFEEVELPLEQRRVVAYTCAKALVTEVNRLSAAKKSSGISAAEEEKLGKCWQALAAIASWAKAKLPTEGRMGQYVIPIQEKQWNEFYTKITNAGV